jgi:hypothetical protein
VTVVWCATMVRHEGWPRLDLGPAVSVAIATCALGCSSGAAQTSPLPVTIGVESDPGVPLGGAQIALSERAVGVTGSDGTVRLALGGREGQSFDLSIRCPEGYRSPETPVSVTLRRLADPARVPLYKASCRPLLRNVVVAVTADHGPNLPVKYLGGEIARTDASGAAHILLRIAPGEQFTVTLDTSGKEAEALRPRSPVATFTVADHDEVFVFDPHFTVEEKKRAPARPRGPTELAH